MSNWYDVKDLVFLVWPAREAVQTVAMARDCPAVVHLVDRREYDGGVSVVRRLRAAGVALDALTINRDVVDVTSWNDPGGGFRRHLPGETYVVATFVDRARAVRERIPVGDDGWLEGLAE